METGVILLILAALLAFNCCAFRGALHMVNLHDSLLAYNPFNLLSDHCIE